ncbi:MAG TPA: hypothetical protein VLK84_27920 [Longimicrobium sp.]|nr:hypothetical protein [Longimicrobium sp.]
MTDMPDSPPFSADKLASVYPRLYHMCGADSCPSIQQHGLRSTTALLDRFGYTGAEREEIESRRRDDSVTIQHAELGKAVIRDNRPLTDAALSRCLQGYTNREWYELLNRRVFFWLSRERLFKLLGAKAYRNKRQTVITVDTAALLARHADRVTLSPINSGSTIMNPVPRGPGTFRRIHEYPFEHWRAKRSLKKAVVELAVDYSVPDLRDLAIKVEQVDHGEVVETVWER